ncbi:hypothetical protein NBRC3257_2770 [Gluconobacter thailandicus NBRC 3257]|uniref:Uncharacterized protein n=1 Tax=Gluconobacter thailandicus NBRC 3257 TaxID=1381097 RepID=A0ABQ0IZZ0_GLUTH|nr:hypothetical protein NBRC3257_2770 [Gluconobacter thailandicus NBRC 3257]
MRAQNASFRQVAAEQSFKYFPDWALCLPPARTFYVILVSTGNGNFPVGRSFFIERFGCLAGVGGFGSIS